MAGVRYYGYYSNVSRGKQKETQDDRVPCILGADKNSKDYRKNWARLIQKIYEADPLTCPKCRGIMRIISFIERIEGESRDTSPISSCQMELSEVSPEFPALFVSVLVF